MKTTIAAGAALDVLDANELRTIMEELASGYLRPPQRDRIIAGGITDGSGNGIFDLYRCRVGMTFTVNRLAVVPAGYTFAAPYTATAGGLQLLVNGDLVDGYGFGGSSGGSLPATFLDGDSRAIFIQDGDLLQLQVIAGPVSASIQVVGHGWLSPLQPV